MVSRTGLVIILAIVLAGVFTTGYLVGSSRSGAESQGDNKALTNTSNTGLQGNESLRAQSIVIVDALGRRVELGHVSRIVSLSPAITETVFALGASDLLVGVDNSSNYPPQLENLVSGGRVKRVGGYWWSTIDLEEIAGLKPDLVIADAGAHTPLLSKFEELGLKVIYVNGGKARDISDVKRDIMLIGEALGRVEEAESLVAGIDNAIESVTNRLSQANASRVSVYIEVGFYGNQLWSAGGDTFISNLISLAGGVNVFSKYSGFPQVGFEDVIAASPEKIIAVSSYMSENDAARYLEDISHRPGWSRINATIYVVYGDAADALLRPGPRIAEALNLLAKIIHPEVFGNPPATGVISSGLSAMPARISVPVPPALA